MSAQRPSDLLKNKTNVHPVVNRSTQATAEDFVENGAILENHADLIDALLRDTAAEFYGVFETLAALQAAYPIAEEDGFAIITEGGGDPIDIAIYSVADGWEIQAQTEQVLLYNNRATFPAEGQEKIWYIDKTAAKAYLWYNAAYNAMFGTGTPTPSKPFKKYFLPLSGIDQSQPPQEVIAAAIAAHAPWTCSAGQKFWFYTVHQVGTQTNYGFEIRNYFLNTSLTTITNPPAQPIAADDVVFLGRIPAVLVDEDDNELVAALGNIGTTPLEDVINLGKLIGGGPARGPYEVSTLLFITATQTIGGVPTLKRYIFDASPGLYGGDDLGTDPAILEAFDYMFKDITAQPVLNPTGMFTNTYDDIAEMLSEQAEQNTLNRILVQDATADPNITFASGETKLQAEYRFNGTATGSINDYTLISAPYGNHTGILFTTDESLYLDPSTLELRANVSDFSEKYTYSSGDQEFVLTNTPVKIIFISVNGQLLEDPLTQWSIDVPTKTITIVDGLDAGDRITIHYQHYIEI